MSTARWFGGRTVTAAKLLAVAVLPVMLLTPAATVAVVTAAPASADCGDPGQTPCAGPVPSPDEVAGILNQLTDPDTPDPAKSALVDGGLSSKKLAELDQRADKLDQCGYIPMKFVVTDIEPAPNNYAGASVSVPSPSIWPMPLVLVERDGQWLVTRDTLLKILDALWSESGLGWVTFGCDPPD